MKKTYFALGALALTLGCGSLQAYSNNSAAPQESVSSESIRLTEFANGATVDLPLGTDLEVSLFDQSGSTGFSWNFVDSTPGVLALQGEPSFEKEYFSHHYPPGYKGPRSPVVGMRQHEVWHFKPLIAGTTTLTFSSQRSWETAPAAKVVTFTINVVQ